MGNLDRRVDEGLIKDIFSKIGLVKRCKMINEVSPLFDLSNVVFQ